MGIAESISAVGIAGTVTGLSYTQATAQQKEEEEEAKRAADEAAQATAAPTRNSNRDKQRAGADENGPSRGAFPVSGTLGGGGNGRGPGPGRQKGGGTTASDTGGRQDGGNRNTTGRKDGRGGTGKQRAPTEQSNRPHSASQKKKKQNLNRRNQLPSAAEDNVPSSDAQNPPTTVTQSTTPVKGQRRGGGISKKQNASSVPGQTDNETEKPAIDSGAVATMQEETAPAAAVDNKSIAKTNRRKNGKSRSNTRVPQSSTTSPSLATNTTSPSALSPPPAQNTSSLHPHPLSNPQVPRNESRARSRKPRGRPHTKVDTVAPSQLQSPSSQIVQNPSKTQDHPAATNPVVSPNPSQARQGKGRGGRRANIERSTPLVSSSQLNHPTTEDG
ncbi:hypothetical protein C8R41DRAFT_865347 [Lentinula lateritia]|uniref:Uncharacterized protein n=1 Tax=Lentinula lateritia TaxID=40482 RepID=A0ABQ8VMS5_9AGAR|nr:hypothetical protein C8R41DRAFT_865347 [Lentinula lateritia]